MENLLQPQQAAPQEVEPQQDEATANAVLASLDIMYDPSVVDKITGNLSQGNPAENAGDLAARLVIQADEANNNEMPDDVVIPAALQVLEEVIGFMEEKGLGTIGEGEEQVAANSMMQVLMNAYGVEAADVEALAAEHDNDHGVQQSVKASVDLGNAGGIQ